MTKINQSERNSLMAIRNQELEQQQSFPNGSISTQNNIYEQMSPEIILNDEIQYEIPNQQATLGKINYGSMIVLSKNADNTPKYMLGPHYFMFIPALLLSSWFLIYCIQTFHDKLHFGDLSIVICTLFAFVFTISYVSVGLSNPGIAFTNKLPTREMWMNARFCRDCKILMENKTRHCKFCNVCILEMDHHCIWIGKCIGKNNLTHFKVFIFSTLMVLVVFSVCIFFSSESKHMQIK